MLLEKEEKLDNVANGGSEDEWLSPNRQAGSPRCGHSRQNSNASVSSMQCKKWVDVITGCIDLKIIFHCFLKN